jgi:tungstate transport system substrate-binding protein
MGILMIKNLHHILLTTCLLFIQPSQSWAENILKMSTTTSTENSGLLAVLNPAFEKKHQIKMHVIPVGTGKALKIGGNGDVDVVFVHAPAAELKYVKQGHFIDRRAVMHNDFVIVGPKNDPAHIASVKTVTEALSRIASSQSAFISRGDDSGTHKKELQLWQQAQIKPDGAWYLSVGQGMGAVLRVADEKQAYTLTDRGTLLAYSDKISLNILFQGVPPLFNPYHVMAVNPKKHQHVHYDFAVKYINFVTGIEGQTIINNFRVKNQQLFYPDVIH